MKHWDTVAVVGVGLIGGSIGLDLLRGGLAQRVIGIGRRPASLKVARERGCVSETTTNLEQGVAEADLVIVCTPVGRILTDILTAAPACMPGALITDVGSTKQSIVAGARRKLPVGVTFVGSHPIAGSEKSGAGAALEGLFIKRTTVVTPTDDTPEKAARTIERFWKTLGSRVVRMTPAAHDEALAATSHVPHVVASALAGATPDEILGLTAGGWLDSTRIAAADSQLWLEILTDNRRQVVAGLKKVEGRLAAFRKALDAGDDGALLALLDEGRARREAARRKPKAPVK